MQPWEEVIHCAGETVVSQNSEQDCKVPAPRLHIQHQKDVGNGQLECHVQALQQPCQRFGGTDYESIEYTCKMPQPVAFGCRCRRQPSLAAGTNISLHDIPATTVSPELVTHTLTVTASTDIDIQNTQSVAPSGDTNVTPLKPEAVSNVSLDDLNDCKSHKWRKRQNKDKDNPRDDYALARVGDWTDGNWVICHTGRTRPIHGGLPHHHRSQQQTYDFKGRVSPVCRDPAHQKWVHI
ncbi:hypothetical protein NP493_17g06060 [Ridgeia piscesae]|uniref:Uncharacterized protein n=1 Tax=Ridgeia piscesae TaxID=27915 RepID=A0AAD9PE61_RIDPI|nr:hypothetical protein NP493_17g06060 [Ridgeia piscesae]